MKVNNKKLFLLGIILSITGMLEMTLHHFIFQEQIIERIEQGIGLFQDYSTMFLLLFGILSVIHGYSFILLSFKKRILI